MYFLPSLCEYYLVMSNHSYSYTMQVRFSDTSHSYWNPISMLWWIGSISTRVASAIWSNTLCTIPNSQKKHFWKQTTPKYTILITIFFNLSVIVSKHIYSYTIKGRFPDTSYSYWNIISTLWLTEILYRRYGSLSPPYSWCSLKKHLVRFYIHKTNSFGNKLSLNTLF